MRALARTNQRDRHYGFLISTSSKWNLRRLSPYSWGLVWARDKVRLLAMAHAQEWLHVTLTFFCFCRALFCAFDFVASLSSSIFCPLMNVRRSSTERWSTTVAFADDFFFSCTGWWGWERKNNNKSFTTLERSNHSLTWKITKENNRSTSQENQDLDELTKWSQNTSPKLGFMLWLLVPLVILMGEITGRNAVSNFHPRSQEDLTVYLKTYFVVLPPYK